MYIHRLAVWITFVLGTTYHSCCKRSPTTTSGCKVTKSIPFSFANFQAASSASVFESGY